MRRRQQCGRRHPAGQRRCPRCIALFPIRRTMLVEQLVAERPDHLIAERPCPPGEVAMPGGGGDVERPARQRRQTVGKPERMAHPQVMQDRTAIPQPQHLVQQPRGRQIVAVVIAAGDAQRMLRHHHVADREDAARSGATHSGQFDPTLLTGGQRIGRPGIAGRRQRHEHPVDVPGEHRVGLGRQQEPAGELGEVDRDHRILGRADRIVPQAHVPGSRIARGIATLNRQYGAIDGVERHQRRRPPAERERTAPEIAHGLVPQQRMVETVLRFPDQPDQLVGVVEHRIDAERIGSDRRHRRHRRAREVDRPVSGIEPRQPARRLARPFRREPMGHAGFSQTR